MSDPTLPLSTLSLSSDAPLPTSSGISTMPFLSFNEIPEMTACSSGVIGWSTSGDLHNLTLLVTNYFFRPPTTLIDEARLERRQTFHVYLRQFGPFPDPGLMDSFTWSPVDLPGGTYIARAIADELSLATTSSPFTITNGTDLSCLNAVSSSTAPASGSSTSAPSSATSTSTAAVPIGAVNDPDSSKRIAGAVAGGVIGGIVLVAAIIGFLFFLRLSSRRRSARANGSGSGGQGGRGRGVLGKWNGLSSRDSNIGGGSLPTVVGDVKRKKHETVDSMGVISVASSAPIGSNEDVATLAEEKSLKEYIETVPPLAYRRSSISSAPNSPHSPYNAQNPFASHPASPTSASSRKSTSQNRAQALAKLDSHGIERQTSVSSTASSTNFNRRQSLDGRVLSTTGMADPFATPVGAEMIPMNRSSSAQTNAHSQRRAARKPVPTYDENNGSPGSPSSPLSSSYVPSPISRTGSTGSRRVERQESSSSSPVTPYPPTAPYTHMQSTPYARANDSGSSSALGVPSSLRQGSIGMGGAVSREDLVAAGLSAGLPDLNHKSSFGDGRMVHYLIPDMPPPPRN
ncbi:hypothetical protein QCA50_011759 [Cerrena zonata]|uniref:Uncharacterized protein n=1 Tax=Cerrena zonata TaxID=2478898 RepID=A0AAW0G3E8_9APHY